MIAEAVRQVQTRLLRAPRVLDVGSETGVLLTQARLALMEFPHVQLAQTEARPGETAGLPYPPKTFDVITCTNVSHDLSEPDVTPAGYDQCCAIGSYNAALPSCTIHPTWSHDWCVSTRMACHHECPQPASELKWVEVRSERGMFPLSPFFFTHISFPSWGNWGRNISRRVGACSVPALQRSVC